MVEVADGYKLAVNMLWLNEMGLYKLCCMLPLKVGLGRAVRSFRKHADLSQDRLADAIGVHRTTIGTIERGLGNPCLDIITRIAGELGITVSQLFEAAENECS